MNGNTVILLAAAAALILGGCGGRKEAVEAQEPQPVVEETEEEESGGMQIEGLTGSLGIDEVKAVMNDSGIMKLEMCLNWIYGKRDYTSGEVEFKFAVKSDGHVQAVSIVQSQLGDYELEKCLLKKLSTTRFPKPKGGATEVNYSFTIDLPEGTRKPDVMPGSMVKDAFAEFEDEIRACTGAPLEGTKLIVYLGESFEEDVEVTGKKNKTKTMTFCRITSLGGMLPEGCSADAMQCIFDASQTWKIPFDPGTYVTKVTLEY